MPELSTLLALQFASELALGSPMIGALASITILLRRWGASLVVCIAGNLAGKGKLGIVTPVNVHGLLWKLTGCRLAQLPVLVLLFDNANELLHVDVLPGIGVDEVQLTGDELICELIPGLRK